ncbi:MULTISPECIES: hypothetical protein [unclassified Mesorhizobium]|uniref:hypothetical protein n=1 Tax=unclassified Mesorhizobium TaxID=325217 RepID=UPI003337B445
MRRFFSFGTFFAAIAASTAIAAPFTYVNERFGTVCTFPEEIFTEHQPEPDNGDGQQWLSADGASLICSGILNIDDDTPKGFVAAQKASNEPGYKVTYSRAGKDCSAVGLEGRKDLLRAAPIWWRWRHPHGMGRLPSGPEVEIRPAGRRHCRQSQGAMNVSNHTPEKV